MSSGFGEPNNEALRRGLAIGKKVQIITTFVIADFNDDGNPVLAQEEPNDGEPVLGTLYPEDIRLVEEAKPAKSVPKTEPKLSYEPAKYRHVFIYAFLNGVHVVDELFLLSAEDAEPNYAAATAAAFILYARPGGGVRILKDTRFAEHGGTLGYLLPLSGLKELPPTSINSRLGGILELAEKNVSGADLADLIRPLVKR